MKENLNDSEVPKYKKRASKHKPWKLQIKYPKDTCWFGGKWVTISSYISELRAEQGLEAHKNQTASMQRIITSWAPEYRIISKERK